MTGTATKSDSQIKQDVLNELRWDARVDETEVGVQVHNAIVTLTGAVSSYPKRLAAREAAHRVHGVLDVVDDMRVSLPATWSRSDEDVARAVREALRWDVTVPDERITSTVASGIVSLQGAVDNWTQRADAERAVHRLTGVRGVVNQISVAAAIVGPEQIRRQVEEALERQAEREARRIGVRVKDGIVTLTGTVRSWTERSAVERAAGFAPGVRRVEDQTTVDPYA